MPKLNTLVLSGVLQKYCGIQLLLRFHHSTLVDEFIQYPSTKPYGQAVTHLEELVGESYGRDSVALLSNCAVTIIEEC